MFSEFSFLDALDVTIPEYNQEKILGTLDEDQRLRMVLVTVFDDLELALAFRKTFYSLHFSEGVCISDLGNIRQSLPPEKKDEALKIISSELLKMQCIPMLILPQASHVFSLYRGFEHYEQWVSFCDISSRVHLNEPDDYLLKTLAHRPNYLFNYAHLGGQSYYIPDQIKDMFQSLYFEEIRLGKLRSNTLVAEPSIRTADLVLLNTDVLKWSELQSENASPNGLYAEDFCQLAQYAGASDQCNAFVLVHQAEFSEQTIKLLAQGLWCFVEALIKRMGDYPLGDFQQYQRYDVLFDKDDTSITFFQSKLSKRWWFRLPENLQLSDRVHRHVLIPCSEFDYLQCHKGELPERWWTSVLK